MKPKQEQLMTHFLVTDDNPEGSKLEDLLKKIRSELVHRCGKVIDDSNPIAEKVVANNVKILGLLTEAIALADNSTQLLDKAFGPPGDKPRIGS
jgi:hypothetical protein